MYASSSEHDLDDLSSITFFDLSEISDILDFGLSLPCFYWSFYHIYLHPKNVLFSLQVYVLYMNGNFPSKCIETGSPFGRYWPTSWYSSTLWVVGVVVSTEAWYFLYIMIYLFILLVAVTERGPPGPTSSGIHTLVWVGPVTCSSSLEYGRGDSCDYVT